MRTIRDQLRRHRRLWSRGLVRDGHVWLLLVYSIPACGPLGGEEAQDEPCNRLPSPRRWWLFPDVSHGIGLRLFASGTRSGNAVRALRVEGVRHRYHGLPRNPVSAERGEPLDRRGHGRDEQGRHQEAARRDGEESFLRGVYCHRHLEQRCHRPASGGYDFVCALLPHLYGRFDGFHLRVRRLYALQGAEPGHGSRARVE
mmetsp:Transcript_27710/g.64608  ORF Transcript_27710/g.64608 Transcript_27710/m.64608 type:complete len:200 (+) Transcript_27710:498-1097(+)